MNNTFLFLTALSLYRSGGVLILVLRRPPVRLRQGTRQRQRRPLHPDGLGVLQVLRSRQGPVPLRKDRCRLPLFASGQHFRGLSGERTSALRRISPITTAASSQVYRRQQHHVRLEQEYRQYLRLILVSSSNHSTSSSRYAGHCCHQHHLRFQQRHHQ